MLLGGAAPSGQIELAHVSLPVIPQEHLLPEFVGSCIWRVCQDVTACVFRCEGVCGNRGQCLFRHVGVSKFGTHLVLCSQHSCAESHSFCDVLYHSQIIFRHLKSEVRRSHDTCKLPCMPRHTTKKSRAASVPAWQDEKARQASTTRARHPYKHHRHTMQLHHSVVQDGSPSNTTPRKMLDLYTVVIQPPQLSILDGEHQN